MAHTVKKSVADYIGNFHEKVVSFGAEMSDWAAHMQRVATDAANLRLKPVERHQPFPRPTSHPDIELALNENFQPDFEIVDDGPGDEQLLIAKKNALLAQVTAAEQAAIDAVVPPAKRRFFEIRRSEIAKADRDVSRMTLEKKPKSDQAFVEKSVVDARSKEDSAFVADAEDRRVRIEAIVRKAAKMHHDIDDLTFETIDGWKMEEF